MEKTGNYFLVVAGNIGVGKSILCQLLSERLGWRVQYENFGANPFLNAFYQDMERWGFQSQLYFLTHRFKKHQQIKQMKMPVIQDRSIYEDAEVFAQNLFDQQVLSDNDFNLYRQLYESLVSMLQPPDLTLYLCASPWTLLGRIRQRWRDYERSIDREYLFQLNLAYEKWIKKWQKQHPVLIVETDNQDITDENWINEILSQMMNSLQK